MDQKDSQLSLHGEGVFYEGAIVERNMVSGKHASGSY